LQQNLQPEVIARKSCPEFPFRVFRAKRADLPCAKSSPGPCFRAQSAANSTDYSLCFWTRLQRRARHQDTGSTMGILSALCNPCGELQPRTCQDINALIGRGWTSEAMTKSANVLLRSRKGLQSSYSRVWEKGCVWLEHRWRSQVVPIS
jgi:hypothetical protein